ncbi:LETM1-domain-containing protein, partial [Jaminaea rosea]
REEAQHYWHGTKLLGKEIRISSRLLRRLLLGYSLTRREHRQLKRTFADLLRLIPFAPFIIVPFGELLLPVAIKIFPNMLPSTFESKFAVETKRRGLIKVRLEMAKFLQGTIREGGIQATEQVKTSDEFKEFFRKVRATGEQPSDSDIVKVAKLFDDDLTLDNLTRPQLVSMCRYMQINAFGTDNYLRYQIRTKLGRIRRDDIVIQHEGLDKLTQHELQSACGSRGIQTLNLGEDRLRDELRQWIELHITQRISGTLLILSKAFNYVPSGEENAASQMKSLELTLSSLPDNLINEAELNVSKDSATNKQRLEVLQQQEELIEDEAEQEAAEEEARRVERQRKKEQEGSAADGEKKAEKSAESEELRMTNEQLTELGEALSLLSAKSSVEKEREELAALIKEQASSPEDGEAQQQQPVNQSAVSRSLAKRVRGMLEKIDSQLLAYEEEVGSKMHIIEASASGKISVEDVEAALRLIKHRPDEEVLERLVDSMDKDKDGLIPLQEVVALAKQESGLGIVREDSIRDIAGQGRKL